MYWAKNKFSLKCILMRKNIRPNKVYPEYYLFNTVEKNAWTWVHKILMYGLILIIANNEIKLSQKLCELNEFCKVCFCSFTTCQMHMII